MNQSRHRPAARRRWAVILLGAAVVATAGCGTGVSAPAPAPDVPAAVTVINCGRQLTLSAPPEQVVGLHPAQTEAQALPDDLAAAARDIAVISTDTPPAREALLAAGPDFVYSPTTYEFTAEQGFASLEQLQQAGVSAYVATGGCADRRMAGTVDDLFVDLDNLGRLFDVEPAAQRLVAAARADLAEVATAIEGERKLRVAQIYVDGTTLSAIGAGVEYDIMTKAGADPVYTPENPIFADFFAASLTPEALAAEAPDALVFAVTDPEHERSVRAYLQRTFPDLPAVRDGRLIAIQNSQTFPGTLGNIAAVRHIAESLYPDRFTG